MTVDDTELRPLVPTSTMARILAASARTVRLWARAGRSGEANLATVHAV